MSAWAVVMKDNISGPQAHIEESAPDGFGLRDGSETILAEMGKRRVFRLLRRGMNFACTCRKYFGRL